ncbi:response regulator transcription factor [Polaromonas sp.]|uniref:response regulator transcription factor n=1 Tax=Polaromonas sp. TaxID=1869339 RepID=UPI0013BCD271|nr:response regulator transcription factor [Polaromonas sp.]NDP63202.1 response regulator transcription factor [Polaromonas sp.]
MDKIRLILIDDHPFVRDGVRMRLEATDDIRVVGEAGSVDEAMQLAADLGKIDAPHIVLTDISMRGASGIELTGLFQLHFPDIDVLVLSMHNSVEYVKRAVESGAKGYVLKDAPAQELVNAIRAVYAGETFFSPELQHYLEGFSVPGGAASPLTPKESATLAWLACGYSNKQIARELGMSVRTVETHRLNLRRKLRITGHAGLVKYAIDHMLPLKKLQAGQTSKEDT